MATAFLEERENCLGVKTYVMHEEPRRLGDEPLKSPAVKRWGWVFESSWGSRMANHVAEGCSLRVEQTQSMNISQSSDRCCCSEQRWLKVGFKLLLSALQTSSLHQTFIKSE